MHRWLKLGSILLVGAGLTSACATKGQLRRVESANQAALEAERAQRIAAEQELRGTLNALDADVDALRQDLESLRSEFGAQITALEGNLRFAMPVHFGFDNADVDADDHAALDRFASVVQEHYRGSNLTVEGFADPAGSEAYNRNLSERRAKSVQAYLLQKGLSEDQIRAVGYGESRQVVPGAAASTPGAELNRRVVFVIEGPVGAAPPAEQPANVPST